MDANDIENHVASDRSQRPAITPEPRGSRTHDIAALAGRGERAEKSARIISGSLDRRALSRQNKQSDDRFAPLHSLFILVAGREVSNDNLSFTPTPATRSVVVRLSS